MLRRNPLTDEYAYVCEACGWLSEWYVRPALPLTPAVRKHDDEVCTGWTRNMMKEISKKVSDQMKEDETTETARNLPTEQGDIAPGYVPFDDDPFGSPYNIEVCRDCGALVNDAALHDDFHARIANLEGEWKIVWPDKVSFPPVYYTRGSQDTVTVRFDEPQTPAGIRKEDEDGR